MEETDLFLEIQDDLKRETMDRLWHHFGKIMVGVSVAIVLFTTAVVIEQTHLRHQAMAQTELFMQGLELLKSGDNKGAVAVFSDLAEDNSESYYGLAMLRRAEAQNAGGDKDGALKTYKALAAHDKLFGELAKTLDNETLPEPAPKSPFYYTQNEAKGWQLLQSGDRATALAHFMALRDDAETPYTMRQRMQVVVQAINDDAVDNTVMRK